MAHLIAEVGDIIRFKDPGYDNDEYQAEVLEIKVIHGNEISYSIGMRPWTIGHSHILGIESFEMPSLEKSTDKPKSWSDGLEPRRDNSNIQEISTILLAVQYDKEGYYGSSWCGKGEYRGIISNIDRKYDRLDKIINDEISGKREKITNKPFNELTDDDVEEIGESKIDAVADLANYCLLYLSWLRSNHPGAFQVWVDKNVPMYLRKKIDFL